MEPETTFDIRGYRVRGRVQGVGFRWWARRLALDLGLAGWVRNRPDGSVEVQARGMQESLDAFGAALGQGPLGARVASVEAMPPDESVPEYDFEIRR
jgi:acylphosphatase